MGIILSQCEDRVQEPDFIGDSKIINHTHKQIIKQNIDQPVNSQQQILKIQDQPSAQYAILVQNKPDFSHAAKVALSNLIRKQKIGKRYPLYYIKQKNAYYQGQWHKGLPNGAGSVILDKGYYYQGQFKQGQAQSDNGLIVYPDGTVYEGQIINSTLNGFGILTFPNNQMTYLGQWRNGQPHGEGQQRYKDGTVYNGSFVNGVKQGKGSYKWQNGNMEYTGEFTAGQMTGKGLLKNKSKQSEYEGEVVKGKKHGLGKLKNKYGVLEGQFFNDLVDGEGIFRWKDGKIYTGEFKSSEIHGRGKIIYPNKQVAEGMWQNGKNIEITKIHQDNDIKIEPIYHSKIRSTNPSKRVI